MAKSFTDDSFRRVAQVVVDHERERTDLTTPAPPPLTPLPFQFRRFELAEAFSLNTERDPNYWTAEAYFFNVDGRAEDGSDDRDRASFIVTDILGIHIGRGKDQLPDPDDRGSQGTAYHPHDVDQWEVVEMQPHALRISGQVASNVFGTSTVTLTGTPVVMNPSGGLIMEDLTAAGLIKNPHALIFAAGDVINAEWNEAVPQWEAVGPGRPVVHRISGVTSGAVTSATAQFTLSGTPVIMTPGAISAIDFTATDLIYNVFTFDIDSGGLIHAELNADNGHWEAVQGACPA